MWRRTIWFSGVPGISFISGLRAFWLLSVSHVEEAEAGKVAGGHQALVEELLLNLAELDGLHLGAVGSQFAFGLGFEIDEFLLRGGGLEGGEELFFEDGEGAVEVVEGD